MARDPDLDLLKAIRILAFGSVQKRDSEYILRHIYRWYSTTFNVPLPQVDDIPLEDILTHYFEVRYEGMSEEDLEEEEVLLRETYSDRLAREAKEKAEAEDDDAFLAAESGAPVSKLHKVQDAPKKFSLDTKIEDTAPEIKVNVMGADLPTSFTDIAAKLDSKLKEIPPDIKITFADDGELDDLDWDVMGSPQKP